jgi:hypothetical protein
MSFFVGGFVDAQECEWMDFLGFLQAMDFLK